MNKIIFGGGFDPIHSGHINMAVIARDSLDGDVYFVPAKVAIWKNDSVAPEHKIAMLEAAIKGYDRFYIDLFEINNKEQPYSIDTINYFKKQYPNDKLFLLIGQDQVNSFHLWKDADKIAKLVTIVYVKRPKIETNISNINTYGIKELDGSVVDVSSSEIRNLKSLSLPETVLRYIEDNNLYFIPKIRERMKEKRFFHSLSVAHLAYSIAKKQHLDYQKAYIAGLLHDIAKDIDKDESLALMKQYYPQFVDIGAFSYHQFLGELVAKKDFNVTDEDILNAIKYHTTGRKDMSWLEKLIYCSDKIDPNRDYDSSALIEAVQKDLEKGFITILKANKDYLIAKNKTVNNRLTEECFDCYLD